MASVLAVAEKVAPTAATVLIRGESGTGKEVLARFHTPPQPAEKISRSWPSIARPCRPACWNPNCSAIRKARLPGRTGTRRACFFLAGTGTLFLDEIGEMFLFRLQAKLLRAVQEREARPVGGTKRPAYPGDGF
jgi:transcriptional regulator with PAS, ATPase and Fis domain